MTGFAAYLMLFSQLSFVNSNIHENQQWLRLTMGAITVQNQPTPIAPAMIALTPDQLRALVNPIVTKFGNTPTNHPIYPPPALGPPSPNIYDYAKLKEIACKGTVTKFDGAQGTLIP